MSIVQNMEKSIQRGLGWYKSLNSLEPNDDMIIFMQCNSWSSLFWNMFCCQFDTKPTTETILVHHQLEPYETLVKQRLKFNALPWDIWVKFEKNHFQTSFSDWWLRYLLWNCPLLNVNGTYWWQVNIGSCSGLVPSGNKPLTAPMSGKKILKSSLSIENLM